METVEIKVTGQVQGVGFRYFTCRLAQELGLIGWVRNQADGSVLLRARADAATMASFRERLRVGPRFGRVDHLDETALSELEPLGEGFQITY